MARTSLSDEPTNVEACSEGAMESRDARTPACARTEGDGGV